MDKPLSKKALPSSEPKGGGGICLFPMGPRSPNNGRLVSTIRDGFLCSPRQWLAHISNFLHQVIFIHLSTADKSLVTIEEHILLTPPKGWKVECQHSISLVESRSQERLTSQATGGFTVYGSVAFPAPG